MASPTVKTFWPGIGAIGRPCPFFSKNASRSSIMTPVSTVTRFAFTICILVRCLVASTSRVRVQLPSRVSFSPQNLDDIEDIALKSSTERRLKSLFIAQLVKRTIWDELFGNAFHNNLSGSFRSGSFITSRFKWIVEGKSEGRRQLAYEIPSICSIPRGSSVDSPAHNF